MPKGALGKPVGGIDLAVVDPVTGQECALAAFDQAGRLLNAGASIGEIVNRSGRGSFEGYYRREDAEQDRLATAGIGPVTWGTSIPRATSILPGAAGTGSGSTRELAAGPIESVLSRHPDLAVVAVYPGSRHCIGRGGPGHGRDRDGARSGFRSRRLRPRGFRNSPTSGRSGCPGTSESRSRFRRPPRARSRRSSTHKPGRLTSRCGGVRSAAWSFDSSLSTTGPRQPGRRLGSQRPGRCRSLTVTSRRVRPFEDTGQLRDTPIARLERRSGRSRFVPPHATRGRRPSPPSTGHGRRLP